jgi:polysaccharide biosynthesis transport protein
LTSPNRIKTSSRDFWRIIFQRKGVILLFLLGVGGFFLAASLLIPPRYEAPARVLVRERKAEGSAPWKLLEDYRTSRVAFLQYQMEIIRSDEVCRRTLRRLKTDRQEPAEDQIKSFKEQIGVFSPRGYDLTSSDVLLVQVTRSSAREAAEAANALAEEYITYASERNGRAAEQAGAFLENQARTQLEKIRQAEGQIKSFEEKWGPELALVPAGRGNRGAKGVLVSLNQQYLAAQLALRESENTLTQLKTMVQKGTVPPRLLKDNPLLAGIQGNIIRLEEQLAGLQSQYTEAFPKNILLRKEIERNRQILNREIKADMEGRSVDIRALETRLRGLREVAGRYIRLVQKHLDYAQLWRSHEVLEEGYQNILRDIQKAGLVQAMDASKLGSAEIIEKARVPESPVGPNPLLYALLGAGLGLLSGLALAFVLHYFDHTLKSAEEVERYLEIPVLGAVPRR